MAARLSHTQTGPDDAPVLVLAGAHGSSEAPPGPYTMADLGGDVVALLDELGVEQASYIGISLGGMVGLWLAQNAPDRWHRFVLMGAAAEPVGGPQPWTERADQVRADGTAAIADATI